MRLASHNSMTFLPVKQWWLKPFAWMAKCQNKELYDQVEAGCRFFDIRLKPVKNSDKTYTFDFGHGLIRYDCGKKFYNVSKWIEALDSYAFRCPEKIYVRFTLEYNKRNTLIENKFGNFIQIIASRCLNLVFLDAYTKADWTSIYNSGNACPAILENYASMPNNPKRYGLFPWLYSKLVNEDYLKKYANSKELLMIDFI